MSKTAILDVLRTASIQDMRAELEELTSQRDTKLAEMNASIEALKLAIKLADLAQHGKQKKERKPRQPRVPKAASLTHEPSRPTTPQASGMTIADRAAVYLQAAGEATPTAIGKGLQLSNQTSIYSALNDPRFESTGRGTYRLSNP